MYTAKNTNTDTSNQCNILGDMHAHVPHTMNRCNCKTNLEINEQGYMAVKLFLCIKICYCSCIAIQKYNRQAGRLATCLSDIYERN